MKEGGREGGSKGEREKDVKEGGREVGRDNDVKDGGREGDNKIYL